MATAAREGTIQPEEEGELGYKGTCRTTFEQEMGIQNINISNRIYFAFSG